MSKKRYQRFSSHAKNNINSTNYTISQNFLTKRNKILQLLSLTSIPNLDHVVEIGTGKGHITEVLANICHKVTSYEIDKILYGKAQIKLSQYPNILLKNQNFLKTKLPSSPYKIFANIPFSITTEIIKKLIEVPNKPEAS